MSDNEEWTPIQRRTNEIHLAEGNWNDNPDCPICRAQAVLCTAVEPVHKAATCGHPYDHTGPHKVIYRVNDGLETCEWSDAVVRK